MRPQTPPPPTPRKRESQTLSSLLHQQGPATRDLLRRAELLAQMSASLRQWCRESWTLKVRVVNLRDDLIVIYASSAAALVPLRARQTELLGHFNRQFGLNFSKIEAKVRPAL